MYLIPTTFTTVQLQFYFKGGAYQLRAVSYILPSVTHEESWLITNASKTNAGCHTPPPQPTIDGINYSPRVLVQFREQSGAAWTKGDTINYFSVSNNTNAATTATEFYTAFLTQYRSREALKAPLMQLQLPGPQGARQRDM